MTVYRLDASLDRTQISIFKVFTWKNVHVHRHNTLKKKFRKLNVHAYLSEQECRPLIIGQRTQQALILISPWVSSLMWPVLDLLHSCVCMCVCMSMAWTAQEIIYFIDIKSDTERISSRLQSFPFCTFWSLSFNLPCTQKCRNSKYDWIIPVLSFLIYTICI